MLFFLKPQILGLGGPFPLVVLPVGGEYWLEGSNHVCQCPGDSRQHAVPPFDASCCRIEDDEGMVSFRKQFLGKVL